MKAGTLKITYIIAPPLPESVIAHEVYKVLKEGETIESVWPVNSILNRDDNIDILTF